MPEVRATGSSMVNLGGPFVKLIIRFRLIILIEERIIGYIELSGIELSGLLVILIINELCTCLKIWGGILNTTK